MQNNPFESLTALIAGNINALTVQKDSGGLPAEPARLLNGRGGRAPGFDDINIDIYPPLVFITLYRSFSDKQLLCLAGAVREVAGELPVLVQDRSVRPHVTRMEPAELPDEIVVTEAGLKYLLNPRRGQNPGFFPDMREGRRWIRDYVRDAAGKKTDIRVLNLFAYTCSLSVAAAAAGASRVVNIDKNARSLNIGKRNHRLNHDLIPGGYRNQAVFLPHDIFKSLGRLKKEGPYDLIIADPPPSQKGSFMFHKDYPRLLRRLPEMLVPGGRIMLTLNGPGYGWEDFRSIVSAELPGFGIRERLQPPADFAPNSDGHGLKILIVDEVSVS